MDLANGGSISASEIHRALHGEGLEKLQAGFEHIWDMASDYFFSTDRVEAKALLKQLFDANEKGLDDSDFENTEIILGCYEKLNSLISDEYKDCLFLRDDGDDGFEVVFQPRGVNCTPDEIARDVCVSNTLLLAKHTEFVLDNLSVLTRGTTMNERISDAHLTQLINQITDAYSNPDNLDDKVYSLMKTYDIFSGKPMSLDDWLVAIDSANSGLQPKFEIALTTEKSTVYPYKTSYEISLIELKPNNQSKVIERFACKVYQ